MNSSAQFDKSIGHCSPELAEMYVDFLKRTRPELSGIELESELANYRSSERAMLEGILQIAQDAAIDWTKEQLNQGIMVSLRSAMRVKLLAQLRDLAERLVNSETCESRSFDNLRRNFARDPDAVAVLAEVAAKAIENSRKPRVRSS